MTSFTHSITVFLIILFSFNVQNYIFTEKFTLNVTCKDVRSLSFEVTTEPQVTASKLEMIIKFYVFPFSSQGPLNELFPFHSKTALGRLNGHGLLSNTEQQNLKKKEKEQDDDGKYFKAKESVHRVMEAL